MSEIRALEKLRGLEKGVVDIRWGVEFYRTIDALEAEVAERFIEIPCDASGELCKCGDEIHLTDEGERLMICGYTVGKDGFVSLYCSKLKDGRRWFPAVMTFASEVEHVKPRTVEDVLFGFWHEFGRESEWKEMEGRIGEYADEIRELMGGAE